MTVLSLTYAGLYALAPIALGLLVRARVDLAQRLQEVLALRHQEERLLRAEVIAAERTRLSREMHDVVAHQVSLIAVQAGALQVTAGDAQLAESAKTIRALAVTTLAELRQVVSVLRAAGEVPNADAAEHSPGHGVADIPGLVTGSHPEATLRIDLPRLPEAYERTVYRAVQEGLTNIRKHATGAKVAVSAWATPSSIELRVTNSLTSTTRESLPSSGFGLIGLRERAQLLGGDVETQRTSDSFTLAVTLPLAQG